ncbi:MAG: sulfite dehydrogenase [Gemmatimonadetes bacterium]|nr:sulfite dehydrogenase [Gemmatimonadota bacterium]
MSDERLLSPNHESPARPTLTRRAVLAGAAGAMGAAALRRAGLAQTPAQSTPAGKPAPPAEAMPPDPTRVQGRVPSELGQRSPHEQPRRRVNRAAPSGESETPLQDLEGIITPSDLHYERHHGGVPEIDPRSYSLLIHGMVERPTVFTLQDLKRFPARSQIYFLECSGNGFRGYRSIKPEWTPQQLDGLTSTSDWGGVPLSTLFKEVGIKSGASWFLAEAIDAAGYARSIPLAKGWDDAMIAFRQNGEAIRPEQGYPARLLLPGWEGSASVKWIRRIEVSDRPFMTREETSKYTDPLADCSARLFSFEMDTKSLITFPAYPIVLPERGWWEITGIAWSGRGKITRVDVSTDGGQSWQPAELQEPVLPICHTRFRYLWNWRGDATLLMSRASDETGYIQPTLAQVRDARGAGTFYHHNNIRAWRVEPDGRVFFGLEPLA